MKCFVGFFFFVTFLTVANAAYETEPVAGTQLLTWTPYKISTENAPEGVITWTQSTTTQPDGYHYVQIDNNPENLSKYHRGREWFADACWEFLPAESTSDWYQLVNFGQLNKTLTFSQYEFVEGPGRTNYLVLDDNLKGLREHDHDFLVRPVLAGNVYFQLQLKAFPKGVVTFSSKVYGDKDQRYIMVDNSGDEERMRRYAPGGDWYRYTLFSFDKPIIVPPQEHTA